MTIHGRDVTFKKTVGAACAIEKLSEIAGGVQAYLNSKTYSEQQEHCAAFMEELSKGAEEALFWEAYNRGEQYQVKPLTSSEALTLENAEFNALFVEAVVAWQGDAPEIKAKAEKKADAQ